jgi:hypothetical protein
MVGYRLVEGKARSGSASASTLTTASFTRVALWFMAEPLSSRDGERSRVRRSREAILAFRDPAARY